MDDESEDSDDSSIKRRRTLAAHLKIAPTNAQLLFPLLSRTDSSTIVNGQQVSRPDAPGYSISRSDSRARASGAIVANVTRGTSKPAPHRTTSHSRPASGLRITATGQPTSGRTYYGGRSQQPPASQLQPSSPPNSPPAHSNPRHQETRSNVQADAQGILGLASRAAQPSNPPANDRTCRSQVIVSFDRRDLAHANRNREPETRDSRQRKSIFHS